MRRPLICAARRKAAIALTGKVEEMARALYLATLERQLAGGKRGRSQSD